MYNSKQSKPSNPKMEDVKHEQDVNIGVVTDCLSLNIREFPEHDADVICTVPCLTEVMIEECESNDDYYKVYTASGIEGFCMRRYIAIRQ